MTGILHSSSDCDSVNEATYSQIIPGGAAAAAPPEPETEKSRRRRVPRRPFRAYVWDQREGATSGSGGAAEAREAAEKIAAAAAASQAVDALAPADVGRTRGGTRKLQDEDEYGPPVEPPRPFWVGVADSDYRARMATLAARRPRGDVPPAAVGRLASGCLTARTRTPPRGPAGPRAPPPGAPRDRFAGTLDKLAQTYTHSHRSSVVRARSRRAAAALRPRRTRAPRARTPPQSMELRASSAASAAAEYSSGSCAPFVPPRHGRRRRGRRQPSFAASTRARRSIRSVMSHRGRTRRVRATLRPHAFC